MGEKPVTVGTTGTAPDSLSATNIPPDDPEEEETVTEPAPVAPGEALIAQAAPTEAWVEY